MRYEDRVDQYMREGMDRYAARVRAYEDEGCTTSDAQSIVDAQDMHSERRERQLDDPRRGQGSK